MNYKVFMLLAVVGIVCLFGGCSSSISMGSHIMPDGTFRQTYVVNLDKQELLTKYTQEEVVKIYNVTVDYITNYVSNIDNLAKQFEISNGYLGEHCVHKVSTTDGNVITINAYVLYSSIEFYNNFKDWLGDDSSDTSEVPETTENQVIEGLFYDKIIFVETTNPVADSDSILYVYNQIETNLQAQGVQFKFDLADMKLSYDYAVPQTYAQVNRMRSNADSEYVQEELNTSTGSTYQMKHFVWQYDPNGDNKITIYRYSMHSYVWYITALIAVAIFGIVIYIIYLIKKKFKKQTVNNENVLNNDLNMQQNYIGFYERNDNITTKNSGNTIQNKQDNDENKN